MGFGCLGLLLTTVVLKDKMRREAFLTTGNWHSQQKPYAGGWSTSGALELGWFGLFTPKDAGGAAPQAGRRK